MSNNQSRLQAINVLIQGINKIVVDYCKKYSTIIYDGIVIANNQDGKWQVTYNGETHAIKPYKTTPNVGEMVKVFIPNGNQNLAFFM